MVDKQILPPYVRVGLGADGVGCRILPGDGDTATKLSFDSHEGVARFLYARYMAGETYDALNKVSYNKLDEACASPWVIGGDTVLRLLAPAALQIRVDDATVSKLNEGAKRTLAWFTRWMPEGDEWRHEPGTVDEDARKHVAETLYGLGWRRSQIDPDATRENGLWPFAWNDIQECGTKRDNLLGHAVGVGKTRMSIALAEYYKAAEGIRRVIVVGLKRHLKVWRDEIPTLTPITTRYGWDLISEWVDKDDVVNPNAPYLFVSFERMQRMDVVEKELLRGLASQSIIVLDEAYSIMHRNSARSKNMREIMQGKHHISATGTLIRGRPTNALEILNWTFRSGSVAFPDFRSDRQGSEKAFEKKFGTLAYADDSTSKKISVLSNEREFHELLRHTMSRRLRNEPEVVKYLGDTPIIRNLVNVELDAEHRAGYITLLEQFTVWYKQILLERGDIYDFQQQEILVKMTYLLQWLCQPWAMPVAKEGADFTAPVFPRRPTALHEWAINESRRYINETGRAALIFSNWPKSLDLIAELTGDLNPAVLHGGITGHRRDEAFRRFESGEASLALVSYGVGAESYNFGQAGCATLLDPSWLPSVMTQAEGRMTRGYVSESPISNRLNALGTMIEYMHKSGFVKQQSMDSALDGIKQKTTGADIMDLASYAFSIAHPGSENFIPGRKYRLPGEMVN